MKYEGMVHKYGDHINTDVIIPARYCNTIDPQQLALHCLEDLDNDFIKKVKLSDILVGGENFGCGSSREVAPIAIQASGISCVIVKSAARIFYRNAINIGLPIVECPEFVNAIHDGDQIVVDFDYGEIYISNDPGIYSFGYDNPVVQEIIAKGGLINYIRGGTAGHGAPTLLHGGRGAPSL